MKPRLQFRSARGYLLTLGIPLLAGRDLNSKDTGTIPYTFVHWHLTVSRVIIVNESLGPVNTLEIGITSGASGTR